MREENKEWWYSAHVRPEDWQIREAVRLYEEEGWTQKEIGKKFNRAQSGIHRWITKFAKDLDNPEMNKKKLRASRNRAGAKRLTGVAAPETTPQPSPASCAESAEDETESAEDKIKRLEKELKDALVARDYYNELINVAERQFKINIRKKAGTRQ